MVQLLVSGIVIQCSPSIVYNLGGYKYFKETPRDNVEGWAEELAREDTMGS